MPGTTASQPRPRRITKNPLEITGTYLGNYLRVEKFFRRRHRITMDARSPETTPAERRLRREAQSAAMRERTLALRHP